MAKVTKHTRVIMRLRNDWKAVTISGAEKLKKNGWVAVAVSENSIQAAQMIIGLRSNELVDRLLPHLTDQEKLLVKMEIGQMATDFHKMLK